MPSRTQVPGFLCPSDGFYDPGGWPGQNNYVGNQGTWLCDRGDVITANATVSPSELSHGVFYYLSRINIASIRDGTSTTAVFSERVKGTGPPDPKGDMFLLAFGNASTMASCTSPVSLSTRHVARDHQSLGLELGMGENCCTAYNHVSTPNTNSCAATGFPLGDMTNMPMQVTASSYHPAGVNVCMGDGSVRFVNDQINQFTWYALGSRDLKEAIADF